jgi:hypothetical protein
MTTLVHGRTRIVGDLQVFSPGSNEFELDFGDGMKILLTAKSDEITDRFNKMRHSMSAVGLLRLKNSTIDFNTGKINLTDGPVQTVKKGNAIKSAFIS